MRRLKMRVRGERGQKGGGFTKNEADVNLKNNFRLSRYVMLLLCTPTVRLSSSRTY